MAGIKEKLKRRAIKLTALLLVIVFIFNSPIVYEHCCNHVHAETCVGYHNFDGANTRKVFGTPSANGDVEVIHQQQCTVCGYWQESAIMMVNQKTCSHTKTHKGARRFVKLPTCKEGGDYQIDTICDDCNMVVYTEGGSTNIDTVNGHNFDGAEERYTFGTLQSSGDINRTLQKKCTICNEWINKSLDVVNQNTCTHQHTERREVTSSKIEMVPCTGHLTGQDGYVEVNTYCLDCNKRIKYEEVRTTCHDYDNEGVYEKVSDPTCTEQGVSNLVHYCNACHEYSIVDPDPDTKKYSNPLGHTPVEIPFELDSNGRIIENCEASGIGQLVYYCDVCSEVAEIIDDQYEYAAGHILQDGYFSLFDFDCDFIPSAVYQNLYYLLRDVIPEEEIEQYANEEDCYFFHFTYCRKCYQIVDYEIVQHIALESVEENREEPTCIDEGSYDMVVYCEKCEKELSRDTYPIEMLPHTPLEAVEENRVEPTCISEGSYDMAVYCDECENELSRDTYPIEMLPHTPLEAVEENRVEPTCTKDGSYDMVVYCDECKNELSRDTYTIEKIPHTANKSVEENRIESSYTAEGSYDEVVYCGECGEELSRASHSIPKIERSPEEEIIANNPISEESKEAMGALEETDFETAQKTQEKLDNTLSKIQEQFVSGKISEEEYKQNVEKVETIIETIAEVAEMKEKSADTSKPIEDALPVAAGIHFGAKVQAFYDRQLSFIFNSSDDSFDLSIPTEVYENAVVFMNDTVAKMEEAVLQIKACSGESFIEHIDQYITALSVKSFQDFDKEAADSEFVKLAYQAILLNMQGQVQEELTKAFNSAKRSGNYVGTAATELQNRYDEEMANVSDLETFEIMVLEVMRMKYISVLNTQFESGVLQQAEYNLSLSRASDVESFKPIYASIFESWALNKESEYGMTLEELTKATIENTTASAVSITHNTKLSYKEVILLSGFGLSSIVVGLGYGYMELLKRRRETGECTTSSLRTRLKNKQVILNS